MKTLLIILTLLTLSQLCLADIYIVNTGGKNWKEIESLENLPANQLVKVIRVTVTTNDDGDDGGGDTGDIVSRTEQITKSTITKKLEATALTAVLKLLVDQNLSNGDLKKALKLSIGQLEINDAFPNNKFDQWLNQILQLSGGNVNKEFLKKVYEGVTRASPDTVSRATTVVLAADGNQQAKDTAMNLDLGGILQIILAIIKMLSEFFGVLIIRALKEI